jgi:hypothetical protein
MAATTLTPKVSTAARRRPTSDVVRVTFTPAPGRKPPESLRRTVQRLLARIGERSSKGNLVYLVCFHRKLYGTESRATERPPHFSLHYLGTTDNIWLRLWLHAIGAGARLLAVCLGRGVEWRLVRLWRGGRALEFVLGQLHYNELCPDCAGEAAWQRAAHYEEVINGDTGLPVVVRWLAGGTRCKVVFEDDGTGASYFGEHYYERVVDSDTGLPVVVRWLAHSTRFKVIPLDEHANTSEQEEV